MQVSPAVIYNAFFAVYMMPLIEMSFLLKGFCQVALLITLAALFLHVSVSNTGNCQFIKVHSALSLSGDSGPES